MRRRTKARWCNPAKIRPPLQFPDLCPALMLKESPSSHPPLSSSSSSHRWIEEETIVYADLYIRKRSSRFFLGDRASTWTSNPSENSAFSIRKSSGRRDSTLRILPCWDKREVYLERNCYVLRRFDYSKSTMADGNL